MGMQKHSQGPHAKATDVTNNGKQLSGPGIHIAKTNRVADTDRDGY